MVNDCFFDLVRCVVYGDLNPLELRMIKLFARKPALVLPLIALLATAGIVMAKRSDDEGAHRRHKAPRLMSRSTVPPKPSWQTQLDLRKLVNRNGRLVQKLRSGEDVSYTLDPVLQKRASLYLKRYELPYGAIVMTDVKSGNILALAGHSSVQPEAKQVNWALKPWAPAASVFKLVTAAALLERGVPADATVCYHGGLRGLRAHHLKNDPRRDQSCRTFSTAIAKSINPIVAKLANRYLSQKELQDMAKRFRFNSKIPFALPVGISSAEIPEDALERAKVSAGFWHTQLSPLHGALIASTIANQGVTRWPQLIDKVQGRDGKKIKVNGPRSSRTLSADAAKKLAKMMAKTATRGSGRRGFFTRRGKALLPGLSVAGKTGSLSKGNIHYSWFVGFAPADKPKVAFSVLLGNPARWRIKASTAARLILTDYLAAKPSKLALATP